MRFFNLTLLAAAIGSVVAVAVKKGLSAASVPRFVRGGDLGARYDPNYFFGPVSWSSNPHQGKTANVSWVGGDAPFQVLARPQDQFGEYTGDSVTLYQGSDRVYVWNVTFAPLSYFQYFITDSAGGTQYKGQAISSDSIRVANVSKSAAAHSFDKSSTVPLSAFATFVGLAISLI